MQMNDRTGVLKKKLTLQKTIKKQVTYLPIQQIDLKLLTVL